MKYVTINNNVIKIAHKGDLRSYVAKQLSDEIEEACKNGCFKAEIDFKDTPYIDSVTFRLFMRMRRKLKQENVRMYNPNENIRQFFALNGVADWLEN